MQTSLSGRARCLRTQADRKFKNLRFGLSKGPDRLTPMTKFGSPVLQPTTEHRKDPQGLDIFCLRAGHAVCEIAPGRGGLITRFAVGDDEVLFLDRNTFSDRKQPVRGGIPVLFPAAGRLTGDRYFVEGQGYPMRQHGLARHAAWDVVNIEQARFTQAFRSTPMTRVNFPFDFELTMMVDLGRAGFRTLALTLSVENKGREPMPVHVGLHPYFLVAEADRDRVRVEVDAGLAYDNLSGFSGPWDGQVDLTAPGVDLHLTDLQTQTVLLHVPGKTPRRLEMSEIFSTVVLWQTAMQDFLCVEPWSAPADALNTRMYLRTLEPGDRLTGEVVLSV